MSPTRRRTSWILRLLVAGILGQTLFFKFTAAPESVHIFETLGMEPWGRIGSGVAEALAVVLLLVPGGTALGALLTVGLLTGAIGAHLTKLGIEVLGDGGLLFALAVVAFTAALVLLWMHRAQLPSIGARR